MPRGESSSEIRFVLSSKLHLLGVAKNCFLPASVAPRLGWVPDFTFTEKRCFERIYLSYKKPRKKRTTPRVNERCWMFIHIILFFKSSWSKTEAFWKYFYNHNARVASNTVRWDLLLTDVTVVLWTLYIYAPCRELLSATSSPPARVRCAPFRALMSRSLRQYDCRLISTLTFAMSSLCSVEGIPSGRVLAYFHEIAA